jgi:glycosyltransferase involved in cell wall biosynthesis
MRRLLLASALATVVYTYVLFPLLVLGRAALRPRPHHEADILPSVTVVIAAHNEEASIGEKLANVLALDYPRDQLAVVVASDGSDDGTEEIVRAFEDRGVRLLGLSRVGKAAALNAAVAAARGDILVFSDANSMFAPDALRMLVRPFADPAVGGVAGNQRYVAVADADTIASGEQRYWDFDRLLKNAESRGGNVISATGAIYAIRRVLFAEVPADVTDDFVTSTRVIAQGYRLVFAPDAVAYEPVAKSGGLEFDRKVRIMTRGLTGVVVMRRLLDPRVHGFYAVQLFTHKVLRRLMALPLLFVALSSASLWRRGALYRVATLAQAAVYGLGALGLLLPTRSVARSRPVVLATFFCFVNLASVKAAWNLLTGKRIGRWEPRREAPAAPSPPVVAGHGPAAGSSDGMEG